MTQNNFTEFDTRMVEMVFPTQTNHYGTLFGGHALELMDGRTSVTVNVELFGENLLTGDRHLCAHGNFVLVSVDKDNKPVPLDAPIAESVR